MRTEGHELKLSARSPRDFTQKSKSVDDLIGPVLLVDDPHLEAVGNFLAMCAGMSYLETKKLPDHVYDTKEDVDAHLHGHIGSAGLIVVSLSEKTAKIPCRQSHIQYAERALHIAAQRQVPAIVYIETRVAIEALRLDESTQRNVRITIIGFEPAMVDGKLAHAGTFAFARGLIPAPNLVQMRGVIVTKIAQTVSRRPR